MARQGISLNLRVAIAKAVAERRILASIYSASRNGMSRRIRFVIAIPEEGGAITFLRVTHNIAEITGYKYDHTTYSLKVTGCGMDYVCEVVNKLCDCLARDEELIKGLSEEWRCNEEEAQNRVLNGAKHYVPDI